MTLPSKTICMPKQENDNETAVTPLPTGKLSILAAILMANNVSTWMIYPMLPFMVAHYYPDISVTEIGYKSGLIGTAFYLGALFGSFFWGIAADTVGRRICLLVGLLGTTFSAIMVGFSTTFEMAITARFLWGLLNGNVGVVKTYCGEILDDSNQARGMSLFGLVGGMGRFIGPALGGFLSNPRSWYDEQVPNFIELFPFFIPPALCALSCFAVFLAAYFYLPETLENPGGPRDLFYRLKTSLLGSCIRFEDHPLKTEDNMITNIQISSSLQSRELVTDHSPSKICSSNKNHYLQKNNNSKSDDTSYDGAPTTANTEVSNISPYSSLKHIRHCHTLPASYQHYTFENSQNVYDAYSNIDNMENLHINMNNARHMSHEQKLESVASCSSSLSDCSLTIAPETDEIIGKKTYHQPNFFVSGGVSISELILYAAGLHDSTPIHPVINKHFLADEIKNNHVSVSSHLDETQTVNYCAKHGTENADDNLNFVEIEAPPQVPSPRTLLMDSPKRIPSVDAQEHSINTNNIDFETNDSKGIEISDIVPISTQIVNSDGMSYYLSPPRMRKHASSSVMCSGGRVSKQTKIISPTRYMEEAQMAIYMHSPSVMRNCSEDDKKKDANNLNTIAIHPVSSMQMLATRLQRNLTIGHSALITDEKKGRFVSLLSGDKSKSKRLGNNDDDNYKSRRSLEGLPNDYEEGEEDNISVNLDWNDENEICDDSTQTPSRNKKNAQDDDIDALCSHISWKKPQDLLDNDVVDNSCASKPPLMAPPRPVGHLLAERKLGVSVALYFLTSYVQCAAQECFSLMLIAPPTQGGFSFNASQIGLSIMLAAPAPILSQLFLVPFASRRFGVRKCLGFGNLLWAFGALITPSLAALYGLLLSSESIGETGANVGGWISIVLRTAIMETFALFSFCFISCMINNSVHSNERGTANGIGQTFQACARLLGPLGITSLYAHTMTSGTSWPLDFHLVWYLLTILSIIAYVVGSFCLDDSINFKLGSPATLKAIEAGRGRLGQMISKYTHRLICCCSRSSSRLPTLVASSVNELAVDDKAHNSSDTIEADSAAFIVENSIVGKSIIGSCEKGAQETRKKE